MALWPEAGSGAHSECRHKEGGSLQGGSPHLTALQWQLAGLPDLREQRPELLCKLEDRTTPCNAGIHPSKA